MTLIDIVKQLDSYDEEQTIFLDRTRELSCDSEGVVVWIPDDQSTPDEAQGLKCFLDVWHAKEVIDGKASQHGKSNPSDEEKVQLLIDYSKTGA